MANMNVAAPLPAWVLVGVRIACAAGIAALWGAPVWLVALSIATACVATGAFVPLLALAFGALVGWLPPLASAGVGWAARVALMLVLVSVMFATARLTERVPLDARVEWAAIRHLAMRALPALGVGLAFWLIALAATASEIHFGAVMALFAIAGLLGLCALGLLIFRRATTEE